jgi:RNA polymerase sigma factor (sigma-70 family)
MMPPTSNRPVDWEELVTQNENRLYRTALAILGCQQEAEDAVQDAFLRYLEKAPVDLENPSAWLARVLVNGCKSRLRLAWRRVGPLPDTLPAPGPEEREELEELFSLPPEDRAVIHLHYYEGYSTGEIAQMLGQRPGTVRSRLSRAREKLRKLLEA